MPAEEAASHVAGEVCIVTGANSGLGKVVAQELLNARAQVVMACRNMTACEEARAELMESFQSKFPNEACMCRCEQVDLEDFSSVKQFVDTTRTKLKETGGRIKVLVNNAGVLGVTTPSNTSERHVIINHLGPYLLTRLLLPSLHPHARVINVSSRAHMGGFKLRRAMESSQFPPAAGFTFLDYCTSKLCNVLLTQELMRRFADVNSKMTAFSISPGPVRTNLFSGNPWSLATLAVTPLVYFFGQTPQQGAASTVKACLDPALEGRSVLYMHNCKEEQASKDARDPKLASWLWEESARFVGLPNEDTSV